MSVVPGRSSATATAIEMNSWGETIQLWFAIGGVLQRVFSATIQATFGALSSAHSISKKGLKVFSIGVSAPGTSAVSLTWAFISRSICRSVPQRFVSGSNVRSINFFSPESSSSRDSLADCKGIEGTTDKSSFESLKTRTFPSSLLRAEGGIFV